MNETSEMNTLYYLGTGKRHPAGPEASRSSRDPRPEDYIAEPGLVNAVNVALMLDKPLLLTGEPGTGKSQLAYSLAWELGYGDPLKFETKSTSAARDLFYTFDTVGRFKATEAVEANRFLAFNALGLAILYANDSKAVSAYLDGSVSHPGKRRSVVLIDEVDKAPRDFPNDILNEIDQPHFSIPELGGATISAATDARPVVVITSNSEKDLPDAFLRRCIYYNLPFPSREGLERIVLSRLGQFAAGNSALLSSALDLFFNIRQTGQLRKNPATAECLDWLIAMSPSAGGEPQFSRELVEKTLSTLIKTAEDQEKSQGMVARWFSSKK
jgi:MoxR-like ATPase